MIFALLLPGARRLVLRNLRLVFGERDLFREAWDVVRTFAQFASCLAESLGAGRPEALSRRVRVRGTQRITDMLERGQGFVIVTAHVGPWDGAAQALAHDRGTRVMVVMAYEDDSGAEAVHDRVRGEADVRVLRIGRHPLDALPALEHLAQGGVVAVQLDRVPPGNAAVVTRLFGRPFAVPRGPFQLAGLAGVPVLPVFSARTGYFARRIDVGYPVFPSRRPKKDELSRLGQDLVSQMEGHIGAFPLQWFHFVDDAAMQRGLDDAERAHSAERPRPRASSR